MDSACCPKENQPLRENLATDTENYNEESGANAIGEDAVDGSVSDTPLEEEDVRDIQNPNACWKKHRIRHIVKEYCPRVVVQGEHYGIFVTPESKKDFDSSCDFAYERMAIALIEDARAHKYDSTWSQEQARLYVDLGTHVAPFDCIFFMCRTIHGWNYAIRQADSRERRSHLMKELMSSAEKWRQKWDSRDEDGRSTSRIWAEEVLTYPHKDLILSRRGKTKATQRSKRMHTGGNHDLIRNMHSLLTDQQSRTEREIQTHSRILWTPEQDNLLANTFLELSEKYSEDRIFIEVAKRTFQYVPLVREGEKGDLRKAADRVRSRWCVITYHVMGLNKREKMTFSEDMKSRIVDNMRNYKVFAKDKQKKEKVEQKLHELMDSNIPQLHELRRSTDAISERNDQAR
ncbi:hypothetical protein PSENEW3n2_00002192 [Picochlorum sp. SENEW3]|nr:hypothetical protein PSENEW3n2_00002192 [Picochlorum sp. SENEW3]WPT15828.1 hypothetical protein PSENEW3_00002192 [Picochlorum sp. SENEW3]